VSSTLTHPDEEHVPRDWHALETDAVLEALDAGYDGLSDEEAARRREVHGPNELQRDEGPTAFEILLRQFTSPLIYILLVAAVVTFAIEEYVDTGVIVAVLVLNAAVGFFQEHKADRSVRALMGLAAPRSRVIRAGVEREIDARELVPGDVVLLESGTRLPADLRLLATTALQIDGSLLTGESLPTTQRPDPVEVDAVTGDRTSMAFMGTIVASGRGRGVVVATGVDTELGQIAEEIRTSERPQSPLTRRMRRFAHVVAVAVGLAAVATFVLGLAVGEPAGEVFMTAVALAVAIVPEGLPVALTVALALGVRRMAQRNAIVRNLPAVETLGSTRTIGSDKTGTLTWNRMTVERLWVDGEHREVAAVAGPSLATVHGQAGVLDGASPLALTLLTGVLTNEAVLDGRDGVEPPYHGDPTEGALLVAAARCGLDPAEARRSFPVVTEVPFEPDLRYSLSIREVGDEHVLFLKGAPESVLELCDRRATSAGDVPLDRDETLAAAHALADEGLRILAMAYRPLGGPVTDPDAPPAPDGLILVGMQGMLDPPRPGVIDAIAGCERAGIRVIMITGDHAATARAIAHDLGLIDDREAPVLTGRAVAAMDDDGLARAVLEVDVFARVGPDHKHRIVTALQSHGEITAVTGDGVNDGPALYAADIGIAMGRSGTDVAREASDMVLADDDFVSIYAAVEQGRVVFDNVRKVTFFLLSTGAAAIVVILYSLGAGWPLPLLPAQLLWLNVVTNGLQDVALAFEPGERGVLDRPPRGAREPVISALLWERTALTGLVMAIGSLVLFRLTLDGGAPLDEARAVALSTLVIAMAFHVYNARSERRSILRVNPLHNPFLMVATAGALALHAAALRWEPTQFVLRVAALDAATWLRMVVVASTVVLVSEVHKLVRSE
jgi:calcium-translocating P-type ATPase